MINDDPIFSRPATNNPYRYALGEFYRRIKWDLNINSFISRRKLIRLKNSHKGEKAVILANGPSLRDVDLNELKNVYTFGLNKIYLLFDKTDFRPSSITVVNLDVMKQNYDFFNHTNIPLFIDNWGIRYIKPRENVVYIHHSSQPKFARDVSISYYMGATVTFAAMQLAFHMGFDKVAVVGLDHFFKEKGFSAQLVENKGEDLNHFDPNYFKGQVWGLPDLPNAEFAYNMAKDQFNMAGRMLVNCSSKTNLSPDIIPQMNLQKFLEL
jgi:hypothetical protein